MRPMPQSRGRLLPQRSQEALQMEGVPVHQLPTRRRTSEGHGCSSGSQKVIIYTLNRLKLIGLNSNLLGFKFEFLG